MNAWVVPGYVHERVLGHGASARVVVAVHSESGRRVAIKYLAPRLFASRDFLVGLRYETRILMSNDVPYVVRVVDYAEEPGAGAAIVMELFDGVSVREMIARQGATTPEAALTALKGSLLGLGSVHALGIMHGDFKPENVLADGEGNVKVADFGMAVKAGRGVPSAGTPQYMAPELWEGAEPSPASDVYAATAVFFECLTGKPPFSGSAGQLRKQHLYANVPVDRVEEPLRGLVKRGLAKYPAARPVDAVAFAAELEQAAVAAYGARWETHGRRHLGRRADAARPLLALTSVPGETSAAAVPVGARLVSWVDRHKRAVVVGAAASLAVVVGLATTAVALSGGGHSTPRAATAAATSSPSSSPAGTPTPPVVTVNASFQAVATAVPPVAVTSCAKPTTFTYSSAITASAAGTVSYRWLYSSGKPSAVRTLRFAAAGTAQVAGGVARVKKAGTGWAELQIMTPAAQHSNKAAYRLLCKKPGSQPGQVTATAAVTPTTRSVACGSAPPFFTFTGTITASKAEQVSYYWALSDGTTSGAATLTFAAPGTQAVPPFTVTPPADTGTEAAELVVTSPVPAVSNTATYTVACTTTGGGGHKYPALAIATSGLPGGTQGKSYSAALSATGGDGSYTWTATGLPKGLGINGGTGTISGTPAGAGTSQITVTATDTEHPVAQRASRTFRLAVSNLVYPALAITTAALPAGTTGTAYTTALAATGGHGAYTWAATGLPAGLAINARTGVISGTPTADATTEVTVTVKDSETPTPQTATATFTLAITTTYPVLAIGTAALPAGTVGTAYTTTLAATGGNGAYTWAATGLPAGLAIDAATGTIAGTPTAAATSDITVTVTDTETPTAQTATAMLTLTVADAAIAITTAALPGGTVGTAYTTTLAATGGNGTYTWAATGLPAGLAIDAATGTIAGTPTAAGTSNVAITVTDTEAPTPETATVTLALAVADAAIAITTAALPAADVGVAYSVTLTATGGDGTYTWTATGLPAGLTIDGTTGTIAGTPAAGDDAGSPYTVEVTVTDGEATPKTVTVAFALTVVPAAGG